MIAGKAARKVLIVGEMELRAEASFERGLLAAVGGLASGLKDFESSNWWPTGSISSLWTDRKSKPRMGLQTRVSRKVGDKEGAQPKGEAAVNLPTTGNAFPVSN